MVRLILEENGKQRVFRVGKGTLKIGSGSAAHLRLERPGIAQHHAELDIVGDTAKLRMAEGVEAPKLDGETVLGEVELRQGQGLELAGALIWLEPEDSKPGSGRPAGLEASSASPVAAAEGSARARSSPAVSESARGAARERAIQKASGHQDRARVQRSRPRVKRGLPTAAILAIVGGVLLVVFFIGRKAWKVSSENVINIPAVLAGAQASIGEALYTKAESQLKLINVQKASTQERERMRDLRAQIAEGYQRQSESKVNRVGNDYFNNRLKDYEKAHLQGNPSTYKIRLFMKRCKEFRSRWPDYEEMEWVARQESRFSGAVNLSLPPTFDDVNWEVKFILGGTPHRYEVGLDMIDAYLARTDTPDLDREAMQALRRSIEEERPAEFDDAMQWASYYYEDGNDMKAVHWLVFAAAYMEDETMENKAADYLMKMPNLKGHLEAYQRDRPDVFEALMENGIARAKAVEFGLL